ncbi:MAG: hypothetical protein ACYC0N_00395 [Carboxydocellales bacterium]
MNSLKVQQAQERANLLTKAQKQIKGTEQILKGYESTTEYPVLEIRINGVSFRHDLQLTPREQFDWLGMLLKPHIEVLRDDATELYDIL